MKKEDRVYKVLKELNIEYELFEHEPIFTVEAAKELDEKIGVEICKNLFLSSRQGKKHYLLTMVGGKKFNTGKVSKQLQVPRMTFAQADKMEEFLDIIPGSVSPLGLLNDKENKVEFLIDKDVLKMDKISIHPCVNTSTLLIRTKDLIEKILPYCGHDFTIVEV